MINQDQKRITKLKENFKKKIDDTLMTYMIQLNEGKETEFTEDLEKYLNAILSLIKKQQESEKDPKLKTILKSEISTIAAILSAVEKIKKIIKSGEGKADSSVIARFARDFKDYFEQEKAYRRKKAA